jgi:hypothetical protein
MLVVNTNPQGAKVKVGLRCRGAILDFDTGRSVGTTPLRVALRSSDVTTCTVQGRTITTLEVHVELPGYIPDHTTFGLPASGLEPGRTYTVDRTLHRVR